MVSIISKGKSDISLHRGETTITAPLDKNSEESPGLILSRKTKIRLEEY